MHRVSSRYLVTAGLLVILAAAGRLDAQQAGASAGDAPAADQVLGSLDEIPEELRLPEASEPAEATGDGGHTLLFDSESSSYDLQSDEMPARLESSGTWFRRGFWYVEQDVVVMTRDYFNELFLAVDVSNARFDPQLFRPIFPSSRRLLIKSNEAGAQANARMTLGRFLYRDASNRDHMAEFTFFGLGEWSADKSVKAVQTNRLVSPQAATADRVAYIVEIGGFNYADVQRFHLRSRVNSFEWNYRLRVRNQKDRMELGPDGRWTRRLSSGLLHSYVFGLRYFTDDEKLLWQSRAVAAQMLVDIPGQGPTPINRPAADGEYKVRARNDLVGIQFGGDIVYQRPRWSLGIRGKAGPYVNFSRQNSDYVINDPANAFFAQDVNAPDHVERHMQATETSFTLLGELGVFAHYHLRPNMTLRVGYEAMWFSSVANAQEQINFDPVAVPIVKPGGGQMYMGASFGLDFYW